MKITVAQLKQSLRSKAGARALEAIKNLYPLTQECLWEIMTNVSLPSSIRRFTLGSPVAGTPNYFAVPEDMSLEGFIDIYPANYLTNNSTTANIRGVYRDEFIRQMSYGMISIEHIDGKQYLNLGQFISNLATENYTIEYYSRSVVYDKDGNIKPFNLIDNDTDYLMLNEEEYIIFLRVFSIIAGVDIKPASSATEINIYGKKIESMYQNFREQYPSRKILMTSNY